MSAKPLYVSKTSGKNLWQEYRIHADRLEIDVLVLGTLRVPFEAVRGVAERPPGAVFDLGRGDYPLRDLLRGVKLDLADLNDHVVIEKDGFWRQLRLTPDDPAAFVAAFRAAHEAWKASRAAPEEPREP